MWTDKLFKQLYNFTNLDGSLSTFSVAGHIRRGFLKAGFKVSKVSGYGNKKDIAYAIKTDFIGSNQYKFSFEKKIGPVAIIDVSYIHLQLPTHPYGLINVIS